MRQNYHEYTVITPGSSTRGARRIVTGNRTQEDYYTSDHYASFKLVNYSC
ncbi:ribonuclease domain-containing protein [Streptomyces umbrinus]